MNRRLHAAAAALLAVAATGSCAPDGPDDHHSAAELETRAEDGWTTLANGITAHGAGPAMTVEQAASLHECWEHGVGAVYGTPVLADDVVYVHSLEALWAFDARTGDEIWQQPAAAGQSSPALAGDLIVSLSPEESTLLAVDRRTGEVAWERPLATHPMSDAIASPIVADGIVVVGQASYESHSGQDSYSFRGSVAAVDLESGKLLWRSYTAPPDTAGSGVWTAASIDIDDRTVYVGTGQNYDDPASDSANAVIAFSLDDGERRWQRQLLADDVWATVHPEQGWDFDVSTSPLLLDADGSGPPLAIVGQKSGMVSALDRRTGDVVWQVSAGEGSLQGGVMGNLGLAGDLVITVANNSTSTSPGAEPAEAGAPLDDLAAQGNRTPLVPTAVLSAIDARSGELRWERQLSTWVFAPVTTAGDVAFVPVGHRVEVVDATSGELIHELPLPAAASGAVAIGDDMVFIGVSGAWDGDGDTVHAFGATCS